MVDFLTFETVITPYFMITIYIMGALIIPLLLYRIAIKSAYLDDSWSNRGLFIAIIVFVELFWRMVNELIIVYFKSYQILQAY